MDSGVMLFWAVLLLLLLRGVDGGVVLVLGVLLFPSGVSWT